MVKIGVILVVVVLLFAAAAGWAFAVVSRTELNNTRVTFTNTENDLKAKNSVLGTAQSQLQTTATARESGWSAAQTQVNTTLTAQEASIQKSADLLSTATQAAVARSTELEGFRHLSATQFLEIENLNSTSMCTSRPDTIDYTSNATVSASLKQWIENSRISIDKSDWTVLWTGTNTAIHSFTGKYYYVYIVYFDEPEYYFHPSVYDVYGHCWLDQ